MKKQLLYPLCLLLLAGFGSASLKAGTSVAAQTNNRQAKICTAPKYHYEVVTVAYDGGTSFLVLVPASNR
jgi:hypothetical protein